MLKYVDTEVVFRELPEEISLAINISNCPCGCQGCHSSYLAGDIGVPLNVKELDRLIEKNKGITAICIMGGDNSPADVNAFAAYIKSFYNLKVGWYSGRPTISEYIDGRYFDYIKIGPYIPKYGPLDDPNTNQRMYKVTVADGHIVYNDITSVFHYNPIINRIIATM